MPRYECPKCNHRWRRRSGIPGEVVRCRKCGTVVYTYAKVVRSMEPNMGKLPVSLDEPR